VDAGYLTQITELLMIAVAVAVAVKYIRLPYTVALVFVGLTIGFTDVFPALHLSKEVILFVFLPPLLFEGTLNMDLKLLKDHSLLVGLLALAGTLISTALMGLALHWLLHLPLAIAFLLGAIVTPTDPVSVLATFKEHGVTKGLSTIVEGESVFNDGIGVVIYLLLLETIGGHELTAPWAMKMFFWEVLAGAGVGLVLGMIAHGILGKIDDHLIEVLISLILAYGSYLLAERLHCSGVVAVVCAGLFMGNYGRILSMSPRTRMSLSHFWDVVAFTVNSLLFLLIGIDLDSGSLIHLLPKIALVFVLMLVARSFTVYLITFISARLGRDTSLAWRHVMNWAGLRGSIPIALVLGLPIAMTQRDELVGIVFGVVFFSLVIQGLTIQPLLKKLGLIGDDEGQQSDYEQALAERIAAKAASRELDAMLSAGEISDSLHNELSERLAGRDRESSIEMSRLKSEHEEIRNSMNERVARRLGYAQHTALQQAFIKGLLGDKTYEHAIDQVATEIEHGALLKGQDEEEV
jgi:Na+:H+ antiporter